MVRMSGESIISFTLSVPPSVNAMYRRNPHSYGLYKTNEAKAWINESLIRMRLQRVPKRHFKNGVDLTFNFYFNRDRDIDSGEKALLDLLEEYGLVENDKYVRSKFTTKDQDKKNPRVEVEVVDN